MAPRQWFSRKFARLLPAKSSDGRSDAPVKPNVERSSSDNLSRVGDEIRHEVPPSVSKDIYPNLPTNHSAALPAVSIKPLLVLDKSMGGALSDGNHPQVNAQKASENVETLSSTPSPTFVELSPSPSHSSADSQHLSATIPDSNLPAPIVTTMNFGPTPMDVDEPPAKLEGKPLLGGKIFPTKGSDYGFKVLEECPNPIIDVILIHGLDGHRLHTFTEGDVCWPKDLLPEFCPQARIATYGYNAATGGDAKQLSAECLFAHGQTLLAKLVAWRKKTKTTDRPIVFVAYSIGGLVLKHALIRANDAANTMLDNAARIGTNGGAQDESDIIPMDACLVKSTTYGIIFLGTPHQGVPFEDLRDFLKNMDAFAKKAVGNDVLLHSEHLYNQLDSFTNISGDFDTKLAYEVRRTTLSDGRLVLLVPKSTAVLPGQVNTETIGMERNHYEIATFTEKEDSDFETLTYWLQDMIRKAPARVERNFAALTKEALISKFGQDAKKMAIFQASFSGPQVPGRFGGMVNRTSG